jgi:hypothetical protein
MGYGSFGTRERFRAPVALRYTLFELSSRRASSLANFEHRQSSIDINHVDSIRCEYSPITVSAIFLPRKLRAVSVHSVGADTSLYWTTGAYYSAHLTPPYARVRNGTSSMRSTHIAQVGVRSAHCRQFNELEGHTRLIK